MTFQDNQQICNNFHTSKVEPWHGTEQGKLSTHSYANNLSLEYLPGAEINLLL